MSEDAPNVRVDREYMNELELYVTRMTLLRMADYINAATRSGAIYGQVILPPDQAAIKAGGAQ